MFQFSFNVIFRKKTQGIPIGLICKPSNTLDTILVYSVQHFVIITDHLMTKFTNNTSNAIF